MIWLYPQILLFLALQAALACVPAGLAVWAASCLGSGGLPTLTMAVYALAIAGFWAVLAGWSALTAFSLGVQRLRGGQPSLADTWRAVPSFVRTLLHCRRSALRPAQPAGEARPFAPFVLLGVVVDQADAQEAMERADALALVHRGEVEDVTALGELAGGLAAGLGLALFVLAAAYAILPEYSFFGHLAEKLPAGASPGVAFAFFILPVFCACAFVLLYLAACVLIYATAVYLFASEDCQDRVLRHFPRSCLTGPSREEGGFGGPARKALKRILPYRLPLAVAWRSGAMLLVLAFFFVFFDGDAVLLRQYALSSGVPATGVITSRYEPAISKGLPSYLVAFNYQHAPGLAPWVVAPVSRGAYDRAAEGGTIPVHYLPGHPGWAVPDDDGGFSRGRSRFLAAVLTAYLAVATLYTLARRPAR